ncbi:MAG: S8 family serine peptidase [Candidatus Latescibacteria bacterium]|nr:S8 family serine peptidase [Candidatus Latescibacterota bacterium]
MAIIDGGFKGAKELSGDMPARWWYHDYTGEGIYAGDSVHGTACAEIIHDVAPEAELYLYKTGDMVDFENAKDRCIRNGIDIINYSSGWFGTGIGDGRGIACDIVNDAADNGILWVSSAGNNAKSHYDGFWSDSDDDGWQNFSGEDEVLAFEAEEGDEISIFLTWNDWPSSRENYDLYLDFVNSSGDLETVAESTDRQNISGGEPVESIEYKVERSGEYGVSIRSEDARPRRLKIWSLNHDFEEYSVAENSIGSPADARGAMSVGAVHYDYYDLGRVADYSSRGPTTDGRFKPELVAPSGVSTVSYGESEFFYGYTGTSAAAPHVAGAAALIKSANPSYSRTQLWDALVDATVDIGPRGRDNDSGYGKLVLPIMQVSANTSPRISSISPRTGRTHTVVTVSGSNFGSSRGSSTVRIGSVVIPSSALASWSNTQIRFRIPLNTPPGNLTVRTSQGTSNSIRLQITSPYLTGISPTRAQTGDRLTLTGGNFGTRRGTGYVFFASNVRPSAADYVSWSNSRIVVKVPARARSGNVQVTTSNGTSGTKRLVIESASPRITSVSPRRVQYNQGVTVTGSNFGSSRGNSTVRIGSVAIPSSSLASWSNTRIRFRVPTNVRSGNVTVRTSAGTSNAILLEIISPYLASVSPSRVKIGDRLTLIGANFRSSRGAVTSALRPMSGHRLAIT